MPPRHRLAELIIGLVSAATLMTVVIVSLQAAPVAVFDMEWRPFAGFVLVSMLALVGLIAVLSIKVRYRTAAYYWILSFIVVNLMWQTIILLQILSRTVDAAMFWQGITPLAAVLVPPTAFYFVLSYIDESDFPGGMLLRLSPLLLTAVFLYISGATELIESHHAHNISLNYWGWQSDGGPLGPVVLAWGATLMATGLVLLVRRYHELRDSHHRRQVKIFIAGFANYFVLGVVIDFGFYYANAHILPQLTFVYSTLLAGVLSYGVVRYGLLRVSAVSQSVTVLENLAEAVIGITPRGHVEFANTTAEQMLGVARHQLTGRVLSGFFKPEIYRQLHQLLDGPNDIASLEDAEILDRRRRPVPVNITSTRLYDSGRPAGYVLVIQNVTELRRKAQELEREKASVERKVVERTRQLRDEQAKLRAAIEGLNLGIALVDNDTNLVVQNRAFHSILELAHEAASLDQASAHFAGFDLAVQCRRSQTEDRPIETNDVALANKIVRVFTAPVHVLADNDIATIGTVVLVEDFTEAKVLERSRDEFFSIASHELRTPLTAIKGNAAMLMDYYGSTIKQPAVKEMVHDIRESSTRLIEIVSDFLDLSRLQQGKMVFQIGPTQLEPLIEQVAYEMKPILSEKHLQFTAQHLTLDELPLVQADANRVKQVLYNLIGNSAIHTDAGGITVSAEVTARNVTVHVIDTGRGITQEGQKFLFHKFQQAANSILTRDSTRGTGLGLYISKLMIEHMGGTIQLDYTEVDHGSSFSFTLPRADASPAKPAPAKVGRAKN